MARPRGIWSEKRFRDALIKLACEKALNGKQRVENVAEQLLMAAESGEGWAVSEFANRLDGKPAQAIIGGDEDDPPIAVQLIELRAVKPDAPAD